MCVFLSLLELLFYGERQPRVVDDIIDLILTCSLYLNYELLSGDDKTDISEEALKREENGGKKIMTPEETKSLLHRAVYTYGCSAQQDVAIEEMSELTKALLKFRRAGTLVDEETKGKLRSDVAEEVADVLITIEQLKIMFDIEDDVEAWKEKKLSRLKERLSSD